MTAQGKYAAIKEINEQPLSLMVQSLLRPDYRNGDPSRRLTLPMLFVDVANDPSAVSRGVLDHLMLEELGWALTDPDDPWATTALLMLHQDPSQPPLTPHQTRRAMMRLYLTAVDEGQDARATIEADLLSNLMEIEPELRLATG